MEILDEAMKIVQHVDMYVQRTLSLVFGMERDLTEQAGLVMILK